jgi:hypothetical protein
LAVIERKSLIRPDLQKQKTGVDSLKRLHSRLRDAFEVTQQFAGLDGLAVKMWKLLQAKQQLREALVTLSDNIAGTIKELDNFEAGTPSMHLTKCYGAEVLNPAFSVLTEEYESLHQGIMGSTLMEKLQPSNKPEHIQMLQNSILIATGVNLYKE